MNKVCLLFHEGFTKIVNVPEEHDVFQLSEFVDQQPGLIARKPIIESVHIRKRNFRHISRFSTGLRVFVEQECFLETLNGKRIK